LLVVAEAHRTRQPGARGDDLSNLLRQEQRIVGVVQVSSDVRLVPSPYLDGMPEIAQQAHHLLGRLVVGVGVQRQEGRVGAFPGRGAQRHAGVHTEFPRRIRRACHHFAWFVRIAVTADDDRQAREFRITTHLDGGLELVEVDVQHPTGHVPQSLRARLSHASPRLCKVDSSSVSWWCT
jgi:hypothetical protein